MGRHSEGKHDNDQRQREARLHAVSPAAIGHFHGGLLAGGEGRRYACFRSSARIGSRRMRRPVSVKIALATAGATGGTPGSPTPPILSVLGTMYASTSGASFIRSIG